MAALRPRRSVGPSAFEAFEGTAHPRFQGSTTERAIVCATQPSIRRGIAECLRGDGHIVDEATGLAGLGAALALHEIDLIVVGDAIFDAASAAGLPLSRIAKVVVVADSVQAIDAVRILDRGASAYLLSNIAPKTLAEACRAVLGGAEVIDETLTAVMAPQAELRRRARRVSTGNSEQVVLSEREYEVAGLLRNGVPTREIAAKLGISAVTVRRHISTTMDKVGVASRESLRRVLCAA